jgi:hypothetical protein
MLQSPRVTGTTTLSALNDIATSATVMAEKSSMTTKTIPMSTSTWQEGPNMPK